LLLIIFMLKFLLTKITKVFKRKIVPVASLTASPNAAPSTSGGQTPEKGDPFSDLKETVHFIMAVLFVGFGALLVTVIFGFGGWYMTYTAEKQATYEDLKDKVMEQNFIIQEQQKDLNRITEYLNFICKTWRKDCPSS